MDDEWRGPQPGQTKRLYPCLYLYSFVHTSMYLDVVIDVPRLGEAEAKRFKCRSVFFFREPPPLLQPDCWAGKKVRQEVDCSKSNYSTVQGSMAVAVYTLFTATTSHMHLRGPSILRGQQCRAASWPMRKINYTSTRKANHIARPPRQHEAMAQDRVHAELSHRLAHFCTFPLLLLSHSRAL